MREVPFTVEYTHTRDGVRLAMGRYINKEGVPVILAHGLAQNHYFWDFPVSGHSFALYLREKGYDVWLPCFRGHGRDEVYSDKVNWDWNIDDLAIYDVDAIIAKVKNVTQKSPFWIGHSLGGTLVYMYLQGVDYQKKMVATQYSTSRHEEKKIYRHSISASEEEAKERNRNLRGLITVGSPVAMTWGHDAQLSNLMYNRIWQEIHVFSFLNNRKLFRSYITKIPYLPVSTILNFVDKFEHSYMWRKVLQKVIHWPISHIAITKPFSLFWYPPNMNRQLVDTLIKVSLNDICSQVLEQFSDWIENKTFRSSPHTNSQPHIYSDNFSSIECPFLMISGAKDKIATPPILYREGFIKISSHDKTYKCFSQFGHNDLCMGLAAPEKVFPFIENWLTSRIAQNQPKHADALQHLLYNEAYED